MLAFFCFIYLQKTRWVYPAAPFFPDSLFFLLILQSKDSVKMVLIINASMGKSHNVQPGLKRHIAITEKMKDVYMGLWAFRI